MIPMKITVRTRARGGARSTRRGRPRSRRSRRCSGCSRRTRRRRSVTTVCGAIAASPAARYQTRNRTLPMASSTLLPKIQRKSMLPRMCSQLACMNIQVNTPSYQGSAGRVSRRDVARALHGARVVAVLEDVYVDAGTAELPEPYEDVRRLAPTVTKGSTGWGRCPSAAASLRRGYEITSAYGYEPSRPAWSSRAPQPREAGEHPALDRPERLVETLRELALGEAAVVAELQRLALLGRQLGERLLHDPALETERSLVLCRRGSGGLRRALERLGAANVLAADEVDGAAVDERRIQVLALARSARKRSALRRHEQEGFLDASCASVSSRRIRRASP